VSRLEALGIALDRASIYAYESGRVAAPDAAVLWGLARIYKVNLEELISALLDPRMQVTAPLPTVISEQASAAEIQLLIKLRRLRPATRKACVDFIDFQVLASERRVSRKRSRKKE
jgi:transcriptional regulator with XRE-family HTH domain